MKSEIIPGIAILFCIAIIICLFSNLNSLELTIKNLEIEKTQLKNQLSNYSQEIKDLTNELNKLKDFIEEAYGREESKLRDPTWEELKLFLETDKTNELIYNDESFDCSGFAIELFKRARANGLKIAIVEIEFNENISGHMLNAFHTDKGLIFVDVSGNENGTGKDKIAYVEKGKNYGTIALDSLKSRIPNCNINCSQLIEGFNYINFSNVFDYNYFTKFEKCVNLYEKCVKEYNQAVEKRSYSHSELNKWYENLKKLEGEIAIGKYYVLSKWDGTIKNIQIYW